MCENPVAMDWAQGTHDVIWRLRDVGGRVHRCELRRNPRLNGRCDVQFFADGELWFSRLCASENAARMVAGLAKDDYLRGGFSETA
jgi:hypothetical protein